MKNFKKHKFKALLLLNILILVSFALLPSISNAQTDLSNILREKQPNLNIPSGYAEYIVYVKTANISKAGTDSSVFLTINGDGQDGITINNSRSPVSTGEFDLTGPSFQETDLQNVNDRREGITVTHGSNRAAKAAVSNYFESNSYHRFNIIAKDVGSVTSIKIRKDNFGAAPDWQLEYVQIGLRDKYLRFKVDKWFRSDSNTQTFTNSFSKTSIYEVQTYTGNVSGAGTDANIFLIIEGIDEKGEIAVTPEIWLNVLDSGNLFERHKIDILKTGAQQYLSQIRRIRIRSDNQYPGSAWYLGWVMINGIVFQVDDWIESGKLTKVLDNPKFIAPPNIARTVPQPPRTTSTNVRNRPATLTNIPPEIQSPRGLTCNLEDWVGTWNTTQGQLDIKLDDGEIRVKFESNGTIRRGIPAAGNSCVFLAENIPVGLNRRIFQSHGFAMTKPGSFVGFVRTNFYQWSDGERWSGEKQNTSVSNNVADSTGQGNPSQNACSSEDWAGDWDTSLFPQMTLKTVSSGMAGVFKPANFKFLAFYEGSNRCIIRGAWSTPDGNPSGEFRFIMKSKGSFEGAYVGENEIGQDLSNKPLTWRGRKLGMPSNTQNGSSPARVTQTTQPSTQTPSKPTAVNVAIGKVAMQSSTGFGGNASRAVDGNTDGNWANNSVTHTNGESGGWWEVDLGAVYNISEIKLYNRTDCCSDRLKQFRISVSTERFSSNSDGIEYAPLQGNVASNPWTFSRNTQARYVRIYLNGTGVLSLAEVQVFGTLVQ